MNDSTDILVVGSGVSGACSAFVAARLGSAVLVCEEHDEIGEPSHCSGHVGINSITRLGLDIPRKIVENEIKGAVFYSPSNESLIIKRQAPVTLVLDRRGLDKHLAELARKAGAEYRLGTRVESLACEDGKLLRASVRSNGVDRRIYCRLAIDAEGSGAHLSRLVGLPQPKRSTIVNSAQVYVDRAEDIDPDLVELYFGQSFAPGFFAWIIPRRDRSAKVGLAARQANARECLEKFIRHHPVASKKLKSSRIERTVYHPIPVGGAIEKSYADGLIAVGDVASQVKPTTGGGIIFGLICGRIAGETAHQAIVKNDCSEKFLSLYERRWRKAIGFDLSVMRRLRRMLYFMPDRYLDRILRLGSMLDISRVISTANDIDYQGRTLARLIWNPRLFVTSLYASLLSIPSQIRTSNNGRRPR